MLDLFPWSFEDVHDAYILEVFIVQKHWGNNKLGKYRHFSIFTKPVTANIQCRF